MLNKAESHEAAGPAASNMAASVEAHEATKPAISIPSVSVVIPTLNEAKNLPLLLPRLPSWVTEILVVDGCSQDDTVKIAQDFVKTLPVRVVIERRRGKGAALRAGFEVATGNIIIAMDADCSMDPGELPVLVSTLVAGADFVKGSRFIQGGGTSDMTWFRKLGNWGLTQAVRFLHGGHFSDLCYGYFGFWRKHLCLFEPNTTGFETMGFEVETFLNVMALKAGLKIAEVPSFESERVHGESNLRTIPDGWRVLKMIVKEWPSGTERITPSTRWPHAHPDSDAPLPTRDGRH